jgi:hypothetical protein
VQFDPASDAVVDVVRLLLLQLRLALATGETVAGADVDPALDMTYKLGVASQVAEAWLLSGIVQQREGRLAEAAVSLVEARDIARGEASQRLFPEIVVAQAQLSLALGDGERALACILREYRASPAARKYRLTSQRFAAGLAIAPETGNFQMTPIAWQA